MVVDETLNYRTPISAYRRFHPSFKLRLVDCSPETHYETVTDARIIEEAFRDTGDSDNE